MSGSAPYSVAGIAASLACLPAACRGQCEPEWLPALPNSALDGIVTTLAVWNGDLVAAGVFTTAGGRPATRIARWDGVAWHALGAGIGGGNPFVRDMAVFGGDLIVAGQFSTAGGMPIPYIARWDGAQWSPVGGGLPAAVKGLALDQDGLVAMHDVTWNGCRVQRWDGSSWSPVGPVLLGFAEQVGVFGGALVAATSVNGAAGNLAHIWRWSGSEWEGLGFLPPIGSGDIRALIDHAGELYAGGRTDSPIVQRRSGAAWLPLAGLPPDWSVVLALQSFRGQLVAGASGPSSQDDIRRWNGAAWEALGEGVDDDVYTLVVKDGVLVAGGAFVSAGGLASPWWARWGCACYADCDKSGGLTVADFGCFQTQFVSGHGYADCNDDGGLTIADFACFQTRYVSGCP